MDIILNKLVKDKIVDILEELLEAVEGTDDSVGHRRILITEAVAQAWLWLHTEKKTILLRE